MLLKKICHIYQHSHNSHITNTIKADRFAFLKLNLSAYLSGTIIPTLSGIVYSHSIVDGGFDEIS